MKLTNHMRTAFVRAVMQDVPKTDYAEKFISLTNKEVSRMRTQAGIGKTPAYRLRANNGNIACTHYSFSAAGLTDSEVEEIKRLPAIVELIEAANEQDKRLKRLRDQITGAINACTTRKQAAEALPEFEKYLPADTPKAMRSLPALANVAADFVKAGWPKGSPSQKTATA